MFVGMLKAIFVPELSFEFKLFWGGLVKKILLLVIVLTLSLLAKGLGLNEFQPMTAIIMKAMLLSESIKILNNTRSILNKKEYKSSDFISIIIEKITEFLGTKINKLLIFFDK